MKYELVKLNKLSGSKASIYTVYLKNEQKTLFDLFLEENKISFKSELKDIVSRLNIIGNIAGAKENFFKQKEGKPGDGVCALFDRPNSKLRLYCIRYASSIIILGGGGHKPKSIKEFQKDDKLTKENYFLRKLSKEITTKIKDGEIRYSTDYMDFEGDLTFNDETDE